MRVLIVRIGAMGDVLHAMPAVAALRARHPDWFIGWAIEPRWSDLLQISGDPQDLTQGVVLPTGAIVRRGLVDRWYRVPAKSWSRRPFSSDTLNEILALRALLRYEKFDLCVDLQGAVKSAVVGRLSGAPKLAGAAEPREKIARRLYAQRLPTMSRHVVEQACELLGGAVGESLSPAPVTLPMQSEAEQWADEQIGEQSFALISPGGGWGAKIWPAERLGQVAEELSRRAGIATLVNASPGGSADADAVAAASGGAARAVPCSLAQLIALERRAAVVIGGDTGPVHLAAALERPVVGIFGPTDPARNGPYGTRSIVLRDAESVTSYKRSRHVEAGMLKIAVDQVVEAALGLLQTSGSVSGSAVASPWNEKIEE